MEDSELYENPVTVVAHLLPGKPVSSTAAKMNNWDWAIRYGELLAATGDYAKVCVSDGRSTTVIEKCPSKRSPW